MIAHIYSFSCNIKCPHQLIMIFPDIQGNGLIISISLTLLVGAIVVYYLNARIMAVESSIARQNSILTNFVTNMRNEIAGPSVSVQSGPVSNDATPQAKESAKLFANKPQERINVSDGSDSDSVDDTDTDTDSESESDILSDGDNEIDREGAVEIKVIDLNIDNKDTIMTDKPDDGLKNTEFGSIKTISIDHKEDINSLTVQSDSDIHSDTDTETDTEQQTHDLTDTPAVPTPTLNDDIALQDVDALPHDADGNLDVHQIFKKHLETYTASEGTTKDDTNKTMYQKMKVDELRKLAKDNDLGGTGEDELGKMKKKDLVALLTNTV